ncbi:MAG: hypothetical protein IT250_08905 [Chitinophagaceae bacterium]|nr:hypothetical protein [Chitinophagaceae bacterium]
MKSTVMTETAVREKLYDFIRVADEKKLRAIYTMLEAEITEELDWWNNKAFVKELDNRYSSWQTGKSKEFTLSEIAASIEQMKSKRTTK